MKEFSQKRPESRTLSRISEAELEDRKMPENKRISADINESTEQPRAVLVRLAPEIATRVETDARERDASPTEIVRSIVCEHYSRAGESAALMHEIRGLIEDRFRHIVYEISRTRSSLYNMVEQSESFGLDRPKLTEIQQLSREDATNYLKRLDAEIDRLKGATKTNNEGPRE
jgi:hypothetical protein